MKRWRIWAIWADLSEDTGAVVQATDADQAIERAVFRGVAAGLGARRGYQGLHAQAVV